MLSGNFAVMYWLAIKRGKDGQFISETGRYVMTKFLKAKKIRRLAVNGDSLSLEADDWSVTT